MTGDPPQLTPSGHADPFTRRHALAVRPWPDLVYSMPELRYPQRFNAATVLLDGTGARLGHDRRAVVTDSAIWTYADLLGRVHQIAHVLHHDLHVVPGNRVLLTGSNSPWFIACLLAVLEAGAVAVPLPPMLRTHELNSMINAVEPSAALCDSGNLHTMTGTGLPALGYGTGETDDLYRRAARHPTHCPRVDLAGDDVALILFSSGTTGNPKPSMHFHRDLLAVGDTVGRHLLRLRPDDLVACNRSMALTYGLGGLVLSPLRFGSAALLPEDTGPESLFEAIARHRADLVLTTPSGYRAAVPASETLRTLRRCVSGGERLDESLWRTWHDRTGRKIIDIMGATELTNGVLGATEDRIRPGSTGLPIPGYQVQVIDADGHPCPVGHIGQLAVRGPTGCRYLAHPRQATAIHDGWTLTGDLCRRDHDGYFWMRGRTDDAISIDGYNVVPAEVEAVLLSHPTVIDAAVVGYTKPSGNAALAAYVVLATDTVATHAITDLTNLLTDRLSAYEHPSAVLILPSLPRTTTGKTDRAELRRRAEQPDSTSDRPAPADLYVHDTSCELG
ncbi:AMP-binding protein [Nocardia sp. NPDC051570]|uniref:AMP-binding protein n=1 Tax=Nocardia sp. NPDC051570 TaxID=3364324 RepID=UPI00379023CE